MQAHHLPGASAFAASALASIVTITFIVMALRSPAVEWTDLAAYAHDYDPRGVAQLIPVLLLGPVVVVLIASLHAMTRRGWRALSLSGVIFSGMYAAMTGANYVIQLHVVRLNLLAGAPQGLTLLVMPNPESVFAALEILGYGFFGLAMLFTGLAFHGAGIRRGVRRLLVTSGVSGVGASAAGVGGARVLMLSGFGLALLAFLVATVLLAIHLSPCVHGQPTLWQPHACGRTRAVQREAATVSNTSTSLG